MWEVGERSGRISCDIDRMESTVGGKLRICIERIAFSVAREIE